MSELFYTSPASIWEEALPIGNGRLGAMIFGGVEMEHLQVNEETMWYGGEVNRLNPDAREHLEEVRELLKSGEISKAQQLLSMAFAACPNSAHPYQTLGDVNIYFDPLEQEVVDDKNQLQKQKQDQLAEQDARRDAAGDHGGGAQQRLPDAQGRDVPLFQS